MTFKNLMFKCLEIRKKFSQNVVNLAQFSPKTLLYPLHYILLCCHDVKKQNSNFSCNIYSLHPMKD